MKPNGFIFYKGPSLLDGSPIVGIVTGTNRGSLNSKTGPMCQTWILRADVSPIEAVNTGKDSAICGDCQHRSGSNIGRSCYVIWWLGPNNVWKKFKAGGYPNYSHYPMHQERAMLGHYVRLGAYGDPAAIPYTRWLPIVRCSSGSIGYTQQWRNCNQMFARITMASVQSRAEKDQAAALGWRTFRARLPGDRVFDDEVICPASNEAGHSATCEDCQLCQGITKQAKSVVIIAHGQRVTWFAGRSAALSKSGAVATRT